MKKIRITESQWKRILESEYAYPIDLKSDDEKPDNFTEYETAINNNDKDAPNDVTTGEGYKRSKPGWFGMNRYPAMHRLPESRELDNKESSGFGKNNDAFIQNVANNGSGKMVSNINSEITSKTRGSRNNTNQVRASRMRQYKETNPELFQKNGGEKMLNILDSQTKAQSDSYAAKHSTDIRTQDTTPGNNINFNKGENGAYYFK